MYIRTALDLEDLLLELLKYKKTVYNIRVEFGRTDIYNGM